MVGLFSRMSSASLLSSSWPPSCLQPQSRHSGASTVHFLFPRLPFSDGDPNQPPSLILTFSLLAAAFFPNCGGWNQQPRRCTTASCWTACAAGAMLQASLNSSPTGSRRLRPSKGSVRRRADPDAYSQGEVEHFHLAFFFIHPQEKDDSRRKVRIQEMVEAKPELALAYLEYLFNHKATRDKVLALRERCLKRLHTALGGWRVRWTTPGLTCASALFKPCLSPQSVLYTHLSGTTGDSRCPSAETALSVFVYHVRLGAHLQHSVSCPGQDSRFL